MLTVNRVNLGNAFKFEKTAPGQYRMNKTNTLNVSEDIILFNDGGIILLNPFAVASPAANDNSKALATTEWATNKITTALATAVPAGSVIYSASPNVLPGFMKCNGSAVSRTTYQNLYNEIGTTYGGGNGSTTFNIPDFRGVFLRVVDDGRGLDPGRVLNSLQTDAIRNIVGNLFQSGQITMTSANGVFAVTANAGGFFDSGGGSGAGTFNFDASRVVPTAAENRPVNMPVYAMIKF